MAEKVTNLRGYPFKKMLIVGKTGTGKSTLCNRIAGLTHDDALFPVSEGAQSCTQSTAFGHIRFGGNKERLVSLIDTIGFDDPNNDTDVKIIAELVDKLMNNCDKVHLFIIAVNGQAPRLDGSLVAMIKIFQVKMIYLGIPHTKNLNCRRCSLRSSGIDVALFSPEFPWIRSRSGFVKRMEVEKPMTSVQRNT